MGGVRSRCKLATSISLKIVYLGRIMQNTKSTLVKKLVKKLLVLYSHKFGIDIWDFENIGSGFKISHPFAITINSGVKIGNNCTIFKGATLGSVRSGCRQGVPTIGNRVVIGLNSTVVGGIYVGDDVFIAPNSFVNFNVPPHSLVIGNPGIVKHKENVSRDYINT